MQKKSLFPFFFLIYELCASLSNDMYLPSLFQVGRELSSSIALSQATITCWIAGLAAPQIIMGPLSDRFGRRPVLLLGGVLFLSATVCCALAPTIYFLIIARFFQGVGVCSMFVTGYASIHESFDDLSAIRIISMISSFTTLSPMIGPLVGSYLLFLGSWRLIFLVIFLGALCAISALALIMRESNKVLDMQALKPRYLLRVYAKIFSNMPFVKGALALGCIQAGLITWAANSPFLLMNLLHLSAQELGWVQIPIFAAYACATRLASPLSNEYGALSTIRLGFWLLILGVIWLVICNGFCGLTVLGLVIPMIVYALGVGFIFPPLNRSILTSSTEKRGSVAAAFYLLTFGMVTLATLALNLSFTGTSTPFLVLLALLLTLACILYSSRQK